MAVAMTAAPALAAAHSPIVPPIKESVSKAAELLPTFSMLPNLSAEKSIAPSKEPLISPRFSNLLTEKNTTYQTFNNQRTESTNVVQTPTAPAAQQQPLQVNLHLNGREIHREIIDMDREQGVRANG